MEPFSSCSNLIENARLEEPSFWNLVSSIFNLMNAVIGAGIIGLAYVMSTIGYVQFVIWIAIVLAISIFTLDLVCNLSQWAGCYKALYVDNKNVDVGLLNRKGLEASVCMGECKKHRRIYSYEGIGNLLFQGAPRYFINFIILFYLLVAITTYFIIMKDNLPAIVQFFIDSMGYHHDVDVWYLNGNYLLGLMVLCVHLPLGLFRRIDFLGFTSFIGMACMSTFVIMVIKKQPQAYAECGTIDFNNTYEAPTCEAEPFRFNRSSINAIPMMLFSFMCHGNILSILAELKRPTRSRQRKLILGATIPCTILYCLAAFFGYFSFYNKTEALLIKMYSQWLRGDVMVAVSQIMVTVCIMFSVPILHYPCRFSFWTLLHEICPKVVPEPYDNSNPSSFNRFWFTLFAFVIHIGLYLLVCVTTNFGLVMSLGGAIRVVFIENTLAYYK